MKKLLGILVLGLLWCDNGFSQTLEMNKCYSKGKDTVWKIESWDLISKTKKRFIDPITHEMTYLDEKVASKEDSIVTIDINAGKIFITDIKSDYSIESTKALIKWYETTEPGQEYKKNFLEKKYDSNSMGMTAEQFWAFYIRNLEKREKIDQREFFLLTVTGNLVVGEIIEGTGKTKIYINLDKGTYTLNYELNNKHISEFHHLCNSKNTQHDGETAGYSGTAFFINNIGHLLTNNHVIEGCKLSKINYFNREYETNLISTDKTLDLALLKVDLKPKSYISFSRDELKKRQQITVAGYPLGKGLSDDLKINDGRISSLKGYENNSNEITVDVAINPGNSGGPIVNQKGQLVAIAVAGMSKDVTEGINFGIKASAAANFLKSNKINLNVGYTSFSMDDDKIVKLLEESTVYTFCE
jgi:S1-C subfamily serine protease